MDIAALVNPVSEAPPRRSVSGSYHLVSSSPSTTSPGTTDDRPMNRKRKRHDTKPIWAVREDEIFDGLSFTQWQRQREASRPAPASHAPAQAQAPLTPVPMRNGPPVSNPFPAPQPLASHELVGYERPVSDDARIYDDVSRMVCDFIWNQVIDNEEVRNVVAEAPTSNQIEVEARWGQLLHKQSGQRISANSITSTEGIVRPDIAADYKFESTMTMQQHKAMNNYLNKQVQKSSLPDAMRSKVQYKHTREEDEFYVLDQDAFNLLPPRTRQLIGQTKRAQRIRVTRDPKDPSKPPTAIIKLRIDNLEISSPQTEWDYRIGVNLEIKYPGPLDNLRLAVEPGRDAESMKRFKDRVSYSWLEAFQIDLTQVSSGSNKNHELELELNSDILLQNGDNIRNGLPNSFESLVNGMMNNLRVLSREITPPATGA